MSDKDINQTTVEPLGKSLNPRNLLPARPTQDRGQSSRDKVPSQNQQNNNSSSPKKG